MICFSLISVEVFEIDIAFVMSADQVIERFVERASCLPAELDVLPW